MSRKAVLVILAVTVFLPSCSRCTLHAPSVSKSITIMSYNVENLFDDSDDGTEYRDYDPGSGSWDTSLYHAKLKKISAVITSVARGGPDICLLQEVENERTVTDLLEGYLNVLKYRYFITAPSDGTATTVAVLSRYRPDRVLVHGIYAHNGPPLRRILELQFEIRGDPLVIFNMHWKSKSGGPEETEGYRLAASSFVAERVAYLRVSHPDWPILLAGDLNEREDEWASVGAKYQTALMPYTTGADEGAIDTRRSLYLTESLTDTGVRDGRVVFFSPWLLSSFPGSYAYMSVWERIDHFLFMTSSSSAGFTFGEFEVANDEMLLTSSGYPRRWNTRSVSGYSDHLPILIVLEH